jgi:hypothetical protein
MRTKRVATVVAVAGLTVLGVLTALPAGAAGSRTVKCHGTADFCGATVSLAGRASTRKVTIELTDTDFGSKPVALRAISGAASGSYLISKPRLEEGGSLYVFTLKTPKREPSNARLILLFSAGSREPIPR